MTNRTAVGGITPVSGPKGGQEVDHVQRRIGDAYGRRISVGGGPLDFGYLDEGRCRAIAGERRATEVRAMAKNLFSWLAPRNGLRTVIGLTICIGAATGYVTLVARADNGASWLALCAVLLASTVASVAGFAFTAICGVMLLQLMSDPLQVVEILMVCGIANQSFSVALLRLNIDWDRLVVFVAGGMLGLPIGVWLLLHLEQAPLRQAMGALVTAYAAYMWLRPAQTVTAQHNVIDGCVGFLGGITGGLAGLPGVSVTIWCGMRGWDKRRQRGLYQPFILIMQIFAVTLIQVMRVHGATRSQFDLDALAFIPVALLGTWVGLRIFHRMSDRVFTLTVRVLLLVSGIGLLV